MVAEARKWTYLEVVSCMNSDKIYKRAVELAAEKKLPASHGHLTTDQEAHR
jgi:hypothetical protein